MVARIWADAEHAVLRVERDVDASRNEVGDQRRYADAEIDVVAVAQLTRDAPTIRSRDRRHARTIRFSMRCVRRALKNVRDEIPGVTT